MRRIKKGKKASSTKYIYGSTIFVLLGVTIIIMFGIPLIESINQRDQVESEISEIEQEIEDIRSENRDLENLIEYLESDQFLEEQARLNFGMKKKGESVVVVTENGKVAGASSASSDISNTEEAESASSNYRKWFNYFFKD